jgi:hypothetical protein
VPASLLFLTLKYSNMNKLLKLIEHWYRRSFAFNGAIALEFSQQLTEGDGDDAVILPTEGDFSGLLIGAEGAVFSTLTSSNIENATHFSYPPGAYIPGDFTEVVLSSGSVLLIKA